ncbi:uncharacterized protein LOC128680371 [Plodia interpunctella]|uniref:uncharacterized protein LOC128680371 n=1 Tax=Plodia interpunctella TaxID=58824 RepID=UPI002367BC73|nr:uncharacterized protein LOC128680371 [Plodia interpunctella]
MKLTLVLVAALAAFASAEESDNTMEIALSFVKDCKGDYFLCVKEKLLKIVDNLRASRSIAIAEGVVLKGEPETRTGKKYDALPVDPTARDAEVNYRLMDGVVSLFETHAVEVKMNEADKETIQRSLEEGRGKKNKGGGMGAIIGLLGAKVLLGKLFIVKLIALKALATAKIALVLAVILFVAWCLKHDHSKTTYEVIPHAHHHESHHPVHVEHVSHDVHGHGGGYSSYGADWNKNLDEAQNLAYNAYSHNK